MSDFEKKILGDLKNKRATLDETIKKNVKYVTDSRKELAEMDALIRKIESKEI